jgi:hypothetical protein
MEPSAAGAGVDVWMLDDDDVEAKAAGGERGQKEAARMLTINSEHRWVCTLVHTIAGTRKQRGL